MTDEELFAVVDEFGERLRRADAPSVEDVLSCHPDESERLRPCLEALFRLHCVVPHVAEPPACPERIGSHRIVREIGRGGMGIVYEAFDERLQRTVALKVLPGRAALDRRYVSRFLYEAQAAARLRHDHIVPVHEVGDDQGTLYFSMQLVDGRSLDRVVEHADHWPPLGRDLGRFVAEVGRQAASALQHAHEHGIVHRDVKPSNLILDAAARVWICDFGVARISSHEAVTKTGDVLGTARYMSPEQASGRGELIDRRTDVYSLGATLYELLTRRPAFSGDDPLDLRDRILTTEPAAPRTIDPGIPRDLETIVLKAMAKDADERYETARDLADDLGRFLEGQPILAQRASWLDVAAKWTRRHRGLVAAAAGIAVLTTLLTLTSAVRLAREQSRTAAALYQSQDRFSRLLSFVDTFVTGQADRLRDVPGAETIRQQLLQEALGCFTDIDLLADASQKPDVARDRATALSMLGAVAMKLGHHDLAVEKYRDAETVLTDLADRLPNDPQILTTLAAVRTNLGLLHAERGDTATARTMYESSLATERQLIARYPDEPRHARQLAETGHNLGVLLENSGDQQAALVHIKAATDALRRQAAARPDDPTAQHELAIALNTSAALLASDDMTAARAFSAEAAEMLEQLASQAGASSSFQDDLALVLGNAAALAIRAGDHNDAGTLLARVSEIQERMHRLAPHVARHCTSLASTLVNAGGVSVKTGLLQEADAAFGRSAALMTELVGDHPENLSFRMLQASLLNSQGLALATAERWTDAIPAYAAAIDLQRNVVQAAPQADVARDALSRMLFNMAESLEVTGRHRDALTRAIERRSLWANDATRLSRSALELARITADWIAAGGHADDLAAAEQEVVASLQEAVGCGWQPDSSFLAAAEFEALGGIERLLNPTTESVVPINGVSGNVP
jgi:tetratricopeptide (TPR) repeat protein/tRNA A-37 threonylcarbamoyl transferase component Bud32